jgi:ATP-dependent exoDNAse (exonuclease V) beta subunit
MIARVHRPDEESRQLIHAALDDTLVVEAAAGTGKTTEMVKRIVRVVAEGRASVREIVAVTFTEKAAGELKLRLRQQLEKERGATESREATRRLEAAVQNLEEAHVSTIHGFCADLLRERPVEARVDPLFRVLTEGEARRVFDEAFSAWFQASLERPPEGVRRSLRRSSRGFRPGDADEDGPMERLRRAGLNLTDWRDFRGEWLREPFDRRSAIVTLIDLVHALAAASEGASYAGDNLFLDTAPVRRLSRELGPTPPTDADADLDTLEGRFIDLARDRDFKRARKGSGPTYRKGITRAQVLEARDRLTAALLDFQIRADADLAAALHAELLTCVDRYQALKAREGALDFLDLLLLARDLVKNNVDVRRHFQKRFTRIFVDEFQDTDPLQAELLLLLAADDAEETRWQRVTPTPGKLFIVGDPKQSIYRFRRADVHVYQQVCQQLVDGGATFVELRKSFRGVPNIQRVVNAAFEPVMTGDHEARQASYVPLEAHRSDHSAQPSVVVLPVPEPYGQRFVSAREIEGSLPDAIGAFIHWLVTKSGWTVTERPDADRLVPLGARHICILFRRFLSYGEDVTRPYVDALDARGVKHLLVGGKAFHDREEIETLRAALTAIEWPDDQLSVFATLRGALFAIGDEDLLEYHHLGGGFHPFRIPASLPDGLAPIRDALSALAGLHRHRNRRPITDTIGALIDHTRAHVGFVLRPGGEQALANVLHVAELARQYELEGGMSFRGFVERLREAALGGQTSEAPILEEGSDGVRLMTVHKAKGLEFPVVILGDITARLTPFDATRYLDSNRELCALRIGGWSPKELNDNRENELIRERSEGERIAYVAATRARDLLVVPAVGDEPYGEGWIAPLNDAIYPAEDRRRVQTIAVGCPPFASKDSVLDRPDGDPASRTTVCPGAHSGTWNDQPYSVVWWSPEPGVLDLKAEAPFGLRREDLIVKTVDGDVLRRYRSAYDSWSAGRRAAIDAAAQPSIAVVTATEAASMPIDAFDDRASAEGFGPSTSSGPSRAQSRDGEAGVPMSIEVVADGIERPGGARFGSLVHALLADMPLTGKDDEILGTLATAHGRLLDAEPDEIAAARTTVQRVLAHPVLKAAARASAEGRCYRETPVTMRTPSGKLVEGTVDLAFDDGHAFVVVDFKTDRELDGALERYQQQVQIYARAIAIAMQRPVRAVLMRI